MLDIEQHYDALLHYRLTLSISARLARFIGGFNLKQFEEHRESRFLSFTNVATGSLRLLPRQPANGITPLLLC